MSSEVCLDANVFLAALDKRETHHHSAVDLLNFIESQDVILMEPAIVVFEVTSVLTRKAHRQELASDESGDLVDYFSRFPLLLQWQPQLLKRSAALARELSLAASYDCSYLAVAETRNIPLITLDMDFKRKAQRIYPRVFEPAHFLAGQ